MEINFVFSWTAFAVGIILAIVAGLFFFFLPQFCDRKRNSTILASFGVYGSVAIYAITALMIISRSYSAISFSIGALAGAVLMFLCWSAMCLGILFFRKKGKRNLSFETVKSNDMLKDISVVLLDLPGYLLYGVIYILIASTAAIGFSENSVCYKHGEKKIMTYVCDYSLVPDGAYVDFKQHDGVYRKELNNEMSTEVRQILINKYGLTEDSDNEWASGGLDLRDYSRVLNVIQNIAENDSIPFVRVK